MVTAWATEGGQKGEILGEAPGWYFLLRRLKTAAKYLQTSVHRVTIDYTEDDIDKAMIASEAEYELRKYQSENPKKKK